MFSNKTSRRLISFDDYDANDTVMLLSSLLLWLSVNVIYIRMHRRKLVWGKIRPLMFITQNACEENERELRYNYYSYLARHAMSTEGKRFRKWYVRALETKIYVYKIFIIHKIILYIHTHTYDDYSGATDYSECAVHIYIYNNSYFRIIFIFMCIKFLFLGARKQKIFWVHIIRICIYK